MLNQKFYHSTIRKSIVAFGNLFNNILIDRKDVDGNVIQTLKVPLSYSPKQKFLAIIAARPTVETQNIQVLVPRMAFELIGVQYDPTRRISIVQQNRTTNNTVDTLNSQYAPTPYNLQVALYVYVKNQDDGLQIIEQILPYFNPDFNLSLNAIPSLDIKNDLPIILDGVSFEDDYEGDYSQRRSIIWTLNFTLKLNFFGPISKQGIIKRVNVDYFNNQELTQKIQSYDVRTDPNTAIPGDDVSFVEDFTDF